MKLSSAHGDLTDRENFRRCTKEERMRGFTIARKESPPVDDVCPVCLDDFVLPCRTDCYHWFCGSCILELWNYNRVFQPCKCPMCSRPIKCLKPYVLLQHQSDKEEARKTLKSVKRYNGIYAGGVRGFVLACLACIYMMSPFGFVSPTLTILVDLLAEKKMVSFGASLGMLLIKMLGSLILCVLSALLMVRSIHYVGVLQRR